jgi:hypothetical protein
MNQVTAEADESQHSPGVLGLVSDLLGAPVLTVDVAETLWDAWQYDVRLPGCTTWSWCAREAVGVLTDGCCSPIPPLTADHPRRRRVSEPVPAHAVPVLHPEQGARDAAVIMATHGAEAVAVVDRVGRVVGLVTQGDIVGAVAAHP